MQPFHLAVSVLTLVFLAGCGKAPPASITLATGTGLQDSGLLDDLLPVFRSQTGIDVRVVAVGSGQAMEIARRGDADVLLTHDPEGEDRFERDGFSELREVVMSNDFIIIGPENDPAKVRGSPTAVDAFCRIAKRESPFISRADRSGTHQRELRLWKECEIEPDGEWYVRSGQGMGAVLRMANEKQAYALGDRSSFLAQRQGTELQILYENPAELTNHYSVIVVSQTKHPHVNREASRKFAEFLLSVEAQRRIADFGRAKYAEPLYRSRDFANP